MKAAKTRKLRIIIRWTFWVLAVQLVLINLSAALYAYKLTHFYDQENRPVSSQNFFEKTWKLIVGPKYYKNTNEPDPDFSFENHTLHTSDSIQLDAWYSKIDSSARCVILFHGNSANKSFLNHEASVFRKWGYNVLMVDFRAHGRSGGNNHSLGVWETDEVKTAFDWARSKGNDSIILYGVSLGASVCIKAVSENKVQPVAIIAEMPFNSLHQLLKSKAVNLGFPSQPFGWLVTMWIGFERGYNGFDHRVSDYAQKVNCPVLVQWGEKDRYVSRSDIEELYESLASTKKEMVVYPEADHESLLNVDPNEWQRKVYEFISTAPRLPAE
jgi:uncharacterized protein